MKFKEVKEFITEITSSRAWTQVWVSNFKPYSLMPDLSRERPAVTGERMLCVLPCNPSLTGPLTQRPRVYTGVGKRDSLMAASAADDDPCLLRSPSPPPVHPQPGRDCACIPESKSQKGRRKSIKVEINTLEN